MAFRVEDRKLEPSRGRQTSPLETPQLAENLIVENDMPLHFSNGMDNEVKLSFV